ncbi:OmpA family protein [Salibacterium halotolerans]|uniref:OmpA-OmpF porin, OOP family n=1 Tax=Salibacterium halotolerans TaxID=1884432 RepID=A0A1I5YBD9_9BACI|nr:OmpA family protein [Salibacterium halotolerans]SFQ41217.1 OmpA-OmpF porin, OOP family [Salibacterium halotolerans]
MLKKSGMLFFLLVIVLAACTGEDEPDSSGKPAADTGEEEAQEQESTDEAQSEEEEQEKDKEDSGSSFDYSPPDVSAPEVSAPEVSAPEVSAPEITVPEVGVSMGEEITINVPDHLLFDFDESTLRDDALALLEEISGELEQYEAGEVKIHGHTDNQGEASYNQQLSQERAEAVEAYFVEEETMDDFDFSTKGFGETEPVVSNDTEENRAKNRRVEIIVKPEETE